MATRKDVIGRYIEGFRRGDHEQILAVQRRPDQPPRDLPRLDRAHAAVMTALTHIYVLLDAGKCSHIVGRDDR
jgi:hypothetical protein